MGLEGNALKVYRLPREELEKLLSDKYGDKLAAVNTAKLARQNAKRANWLKRH